MSSSLGQFLPPQYTKKRYYIESDVQLHNKANDCWVSFFHKVYDITSLIQENITSNLIDPIVRYAGSDITFWFDPQTQAPRTKIDPETGKRVPNFPSGEYLHVLNHEGVKWWEDDQYFIGHLSQKSRQINIINMITDHQDILEVASEETINEILDRYLKINVHANSYVWKRLGKPLGKKFYEDMKMTLSENDIYDETSEYENLGISEEKWYIPTIHLYFNDDLTFA